jgi:hypothetical protein
VKYWELIADNFSPFESTLTTQPQLQLGETSSLLTLTATTESDSNADEKLTAFLELESIIRESGRIAELGALARIMISADSTALKRKEYDEHQKSCTRYHLQPDS